MNNQTIWNPSRKLSVSYGELMSFLLSSIPGYVLDNGVDVVHGRSYQESWVYGNQLACSHLHPSVLRIISTVSEKEICGSIKIWIETGKHEFYLFQGLLTRNTNIV